MTRYRPRRMQRRRVRCGEEHLRQQHPCTNATVGAARDYGPLPSRLNGPVEPTQGETKIGKRPRALSPTGDAGHLLRRDASTPRAPTGKCGKRSASVEQEAEDWSERLIDLHSSHRQQQLELVCHCARSGRPSGSTVISYTPSSIRAPPRCRALPALRRLSRRPPRGGATRPCGGASSGPSRRSPCVMAADLLRCSVRKVRSAPPHRAAAVPQARTCPGPGPRD
jgi:hypothetical protein